MLGHLNFNANFGPVKSYLYSIIVRFYLAFSGFLVFLITAYMFGADGRGIIGYGTSLFAITGIVLSMNLGRTFLASTKQTEKLKREYVRSFLKFNVLLSFAAAIAGIIYWYYNDSAQKILSLFQVLCFSASSFFYVWSINGNSFFASFLATKKQENIILITRTIIILLLVLIYELHTTSIDLFIAGYSIILAGGSLVEIVWLLVTYGKNKEIEFKANEKILKDSLFHHIDFLSFNIYPLILMIVLASYVSKAQVGKFNFALQIINLIFLFSTTANIRLTSYVSDVGLKARKAQYKKLFWAL